MYIGDECYKSVRLSIKPLSQNIALSIMVMILLNVISYDGAFSIRSCEHIYLIYVKDIILCTAICVCDVETRVGFHKLYHQSGLCLFNLTFKVGGERVLSRIKEGG